MIRNVEETIVRLKQKYPIADTAVGNEIELKIEGVQDTFHLSVSRHECILFANVWHEHFRTADHLAQFLDGLLTGRTRIVVKYRGRTAVAHQVQLIQDGKVKVVSWTASLISIFLFWRNKSYKTLDYRPVGARLKPTP
jgi:hypothetical protein